MLSIIAGSSAVSVRTQTAIVDNLVVSARARAAAQAGLHYAAFQLLKQNAAERWRTDGTVYELDFGDARLRISAVEEAGKVSLNAAPGELIGSLLRAAGIDDDRAAALVDAILDWRDPDDLRRVNGAEQDDYRAAGSSYLPRNNPFQSNDEVALVLGMQPDYFARIEDAVTAYSGSSRVDPAVAVPLVRLALNGGKPGATPGDTAVCTVRPGQQCTRNPAPHRCGRPAQCKCRGRDARWCAGTVIGRNQTQAGATGGGVCGVRLAGAGRDDASRARR